MTQISMIAAVAENYAIGLDNDLPWHLPSDLKWFVSKTKGKPIAFGRKTYDAMGKLPSRHNIVITRSPDSVGVEGDLSVVSSLDDAIAVAKDDPELMVLGGANIYEQFMPRATRFYLTIVHTDAEADTFFPKIDTAAWKVRFQATIPADTKNAFAHTFLDLVRIAPDRNDDERETDLGALLRR